jgi:hypothetical protein
VVLQRCGVSHLSTPLDGWHISCLKQFSCPETLLPFRAAYFYLIRYFVLEMRIAKCFANNSRQFRCEVMLRMNTVFCERLSLSKLIPEFNLLKTLISIYQSTSQNTAICIRVATRTSNLTNFINILGNLILLYVFFSLVNSLSSTFIDSYWIFRVECFHLWNSQN